MSAVLDAIADFSHPEVAASEIQRLNDRLAPERTIPAEIADAVREFAAGVDQTNLQRWEAIDPHHAVIVLHSAVSAQRALEDLDSSASRDQLRVALESIRQYSESGRSRAHPGGGAENSRPHPNISQRQGRESPALAGNPRLLPLIPQAPRPRNSAGG